jgi:two-component system response regulator RegX3
MRVAILEDDPAQIDLITLWLNNAGYNCHVFTYGKELTRALPRESFDLFVLDWELPDISGAEVLKWMRENVREHAPVIFTTARDREEDIAAMLHAGADDYLVKPLRKLELLARIDAVLRRTRASRPGDEGPFTLAEFTVDVESRTIQRHGQPIELTQKDFDLAVFLFRNLGRLLSRGHILENVWGRSPTLNTRTVDTHVSRLRSKLGLTPENGWRLVAIYQHGYRLEQIQKEEQVYAV